MPGCFYSYPESYPIHASIVFCAIYAIYCPVIITVNIVLIVSFFATKQSMKNTSNLLIVCLSISDSLIGAIVMPMLFLGSLWFNSPKLCPTLRISIPLQYFFCGMSFTMTMLLAIDRYIHMKPNVVENESKIAKLFKVPIVYILIFACLSFCASISLSLHFLMKTNPQILAYFTALFTLILLLMMPIFVAIYSCGYLRIRRFVAENQAYQNRREANSNESPEYLKELFKTVLLLVIATVVTYLPFLALNLSTTILSFANKSYIINSNVFLIIAHTAIGFIFANSFANALIILFRNKKSRKWLKERLHSCCKQKKKEEEQSSPEVIVNIGIVDIHATSTVESNTHCSADNKEVVDENEID